MRGGLWSSFSVPGAGIFTRFDPYCDGAQVVRGCVSVGRWLPQNSPACNCWSAVSPVKSTGVVVSVAKGTAPATNPLSYRQLNPTHGAFFQGWYCKCVVWLNFSSWSMRKGVPLCPTVTPRPLVCGGKNRAATLDITTSAVNPWNSGTLTRMAYPGILELCHPTGKKIGVAPKMLKSYPVCVYFQM